MSDSKENENQADKLKNFAVIPGVKMGRISVDDLEKIVVAARNNNVDSLKISGGQRIGVLGVDDETVNNIRKELGYGDMPTAKPGVRNVQVCPGSDWCKYGRKETYGFGDQIEAAFKGKQYPGKVKISISGCGFNCSESYLTDIGFFAKKSGWTLIFGGCSGSRPRIGDIIAERLTEDEAVTLALKCLEYYSKGAKKNERPSHFARRCGVEDMKKAIM